MKIFLALLLLLSACSTAETKPDPASANLDPNSEEAQRKMCIDEHIGVFRFSRAYLEQFCPSLKSQLELTCFRFVHATKEWRKACVGIDTVDKLECIATVQNGPSYALLESLQKCKNVTNRRQVYCLSTVIAKSGVPLQPETVQDCLDKNPSL
ncbi:MAG TPA: hypothetical protein VIH99_12255 [Bdellovibrionota bacterium]